MKNKSKNKIIIRFVLLITVCGLIIFERLYFADYRAESRAFEIVNEITMATKHKLDKMLWAMTSIGEDFKFILETADMDTLAIQELMTALVKYNKDVHGSIIAFDRFKFDKQTEFFAPYYHKNRFDSITHFDLHEDGEEYTFEHYFHIPKLLNKSIWLEPEIDHFNTSSIIARYCVPFSKKDEYEVNSMRGVLVVELDLDWLHKKVKEDIPTKNSKIMLLSRMGTIISHPNEKYIVHESIFTLAKKFDLPGLRELGRNILKGTNDMVKTKIDDTGLDYYVSFAPVTHSNWSLVVAIPENEMKELSN